MNQGLVRAVAAACNQCIPAYVGCKHSLHCTPALMLRSSSCISPGASRIQSCCRLAAIASLRSCHCAVPSCRKPILHTCLCCMYMHTCESACCHSGHAVMSMACISTKPCACYALLSPGTARWTASGNISPSTNGFVGRSSSSSSTSPAVTLQLAASQVHLVLGPTVAATAAAAAAATVLAVAAAAAAGVLA